MLQLENRSLQSKNANLRNIAAGEMENKNKVRATFAGMEANARMQAGSRRTAIEQANQQKAMYVDDINTREYDTMMTENMKSLMNFRNLGLEKQNVMNQVRRDDILKKMLRTKDFKYDGETIKFIGDLMNSSESYPVLFDQTLENPSKYLSSSTTTKVRTRKPRGIFG
jgi:hypothetical protein